MLGKHHYAQANVRHSAPPRARVIARFQMGDQRQPSDAVTVMHRAHNPAASQWLKEAIAEHPWLQELSAMRDETISQVRQVVPGIKSAKTPLSDQQGITGVFSLDEAAAFEIHTYTTQDPNLLRWMYSSTGIIKPTESRPFGTSLLKLAVGLPTTGPPTPNLDIEMGSLMGTMQPGVTPQKILANFAFTPRLDPVVHSAYLARYYTAVPVVAEQKDTHGTPAVLTFEALHARVARRISEGLYLSQFKSPSVFSRVLDGTSLGFMFDPSRPEAVAAVQEELRDLTALWAAWRQHDLQEAAQSAPTPPGAAPLLMGEPEQRELALRTMALARYLEADPGSMYVAKMFGPENMRTMFDTCSADAMTLSKQS